MSGNLIPEGRTVQYFGEIYETMHVSSNGMISLGCGDAGDQLTWDTMAIISPYLTDIDTQLIDNVNIDGTVFYRTAVGGDSAFDTFALNHWGIDFLTSFEVVATYDKVRYSGETGTARNTFQAVVYVSSYGDTAVCYNYPTDGLNWPDAASTSYPLVGFYSGPDLNIAYSLPGSGTPAVVNLDSLVGNTGVVGQWCYLVSDTEVVSDCLITSLTCNAPRYFPVNVQIQSEDVLATYNLCNDQTLLIDVNTLKCADLGNIIPVTATIGYDSCITYFIAVTNQQLEYINCPDDITVNSNVPTTVNWAPPTATGDCLLPGQETINMLPNESLFQLGETIVTYTAYDVNYNSVSCSFEVTVAPQVVVTYIVLDVFNRPIVGASIGAFPDCEGTDNFGECSVLAPTLSLGDVIPAGEFFVTFNGVTYSIPHGDININCYQVDIVLIISPPGFYRAVGGDIIPCAPGTYSTIYEATTCISCDAGTFNDDYFATECEFCPAGYTSGQGAIECYSCDAGSWLNLNTHLCELCPANTYSCDRALFCTPCPDGGYSTAGSAECHFCAAGYFLDPISHSCLPCAANTYSGDRATICTPCPLGSYSSQGSEVCTFCVSGFYLDINTYTCLSCPPGTYSCDRALQCTPCPEGGFSSAGSSECQFCTAGNFMGMNETVDTVCGCTPCPAGTFSCDRAEECLPCPPGYWSEPGSAFCFSCFAGYFLDTCDDCAGCYLCPANTFSNDRAVGECTPCPFGSYSFEGATSCIFCNEGYYFNGQNCQLCPAGTFSGDRADVCTPCPPGSYSFEGSAVCIYCSAGYFFDDSTASCLACPANTYSCDRAITCSACPTGSFSYPGSSNCSFCDAGYYLDADTHFCLACPAGFYSSLRADTCLACPEGFWSLPGSATCYSCTAGFYMDSNGNCQICPDGTTSGDRATECIAIPGQNEEIFCFAGYYFDVPSNSCHLCPANTYSIDRALSCTPCPFGSYSEAGSSECTFCIAGYYLDINLHVCLPCPANSFSTDRAIICLPCPYGYVSSIGSSTCLPCPDGSIVDPNSGNCVLCADGMFYLGGYCIPCTNAIPDECLNCPSGTESDVTCTECCAGFYSPNGSVCLPCPAGYYSGPAASECVYCPPDMVWDEGKRACVECDTSASSYSSHW